MRIEINVATERGWLKFVGDAADGSDVECYALPKGASRAAFWSKRLGVRIPEGRAMIWRVV